MKKQGRPCGNKKCKTVLLKNDEELIACPRCTANIRYCSEMCQRRDWHTVHQFNCNNEKNFFPEQRSNENKSKTPTPGENGYYKLTAAEQK